LTSRMTYVIITTMIRVYTSHFFHREVWRRLREGEDDSLVVIAKRAPVAFACVARCGPLVPVYKLDSGVWRDIYAAQLRDLVDWDVVLPEIDGKILLCWERNDADCHRGILAAYLKTIRPEIEVVELARPVETLNLFKEV